MELFFNKPFNPIHAYILLFVVGCFAWICSIIVPFCRREVSVEDVSRLTPLDGLRGILCFTVMVRHALFTYFFVDTKTWDPTCTPFYSLLGGTGVSLFFCITAFLFWTKVLVNHGLPASWPFFRGRIFRLVPLYIFICFLAIVITFNTLHWTQSSTYLLLAKMALMGTRPWGESSLPTVRENAGVVWSLGYEWAFYLFLPALAMVVQGNAPTRILFIFAGLLAVSTHNRLFMFFPGVLAAHAARVPTIARRLKSGYWSLLVIASATALPFATGDEQSWPAFFLTTMIFIPIACGNTLFGLLTLRGLRLMGIVSYSVYLLHGTSLFLATDFLGRVKHGGPNGTLNYWLCVDALACITLIVSICTYRWIEWPFIKLEKRFRKAPSTAEVVLQTQNTAQTGR